MLNVSSEKSGVGAGVLIRAIEPTDGIAIMERNRGIQRLRDLARGPGRLCAALEIDRRLDGIDLCQAGPLWLGSDGRGRTKSGRANDRNYARSRQRAAILRSGQSVCQRSTGAQQMKHFSGSGRPDKRLRRRPIIAAPTPPSLRAQRRAIQRAPARGPWIAPSPRLSQ